MESYQKSTCPGCGLRMPVSETAFYDGYFNTSPECWMVFTEVVGAEFSRPPLFGRAHQLTVDTYAMQHTGGPHPDKSVTVHLAGLYLVLERGFSPTSVPGYLQLLASAVEICNTALVWESWSLYHPDIANLVTCRLSLEEYGTPHPSFVNGLSGRQGSTK